MGCEYVRSRGNDDAVVVHAFFMNSAHRQSSCEKCEICLFAINFVQLVCSLWHWQDHTDHDHAVCLLQKFSVVSQARVASFRPQHHMIFFILMAPDRIQSLMNPCLKNRLNHLVFSLLCDKRLGHVYIVYCMGVGSSTDRQKSPVSTDGPPPVTDTETGVNV